MRRVSPALAALTLTAARCSWDLGANMPFWRSGRFRARGALIEQLPWNAREGTSSRREPHRTPRVQSMRTPFLLTILFLVLACASGQNAPGDAFKPTALDRPASITRCKEYDAFLPLSLPNLVRVRLQFIVRPDGTVDPGSIRQIENASTRPSTAVLERARRAAQGCIFRPGELAGEPVRSWKSMTFGFPSRD